jgi:hypothetical protein
LRGPLVFRRSDHSLTDPQNAQFALNVMHWLSNALEGSSRHAPERR